MSVRKKKKIKMDTTQPVMQRLTKYDLDWSTSLSPGSYQGRRIAVQEPEDAAHPSTSVFIANGQSVYKVSLEVKEDSSHVRGLMGVSLPSVNHSTTAQELQDSNLAHEIQSLTYSQSADGGILGAVDYQGTVKLFNVDDRHDSQNGATVLHPANKSMEGGWAGITVQGNSSSLQTVTACQFGKYMTWYEGDRIVRHCGTLHQPHSITAVPQKENLTAVAEGHQVTIWDKRVAEGQGCISRLNMHGTKLPLYAICVDSSGTVLGTGGEESAAFLFDLRKMGQPFDRWASCVKYDILSMHFPAHRSDYVFVAGADQEVRCGLVSTKGRKGQVKSCTDDSNLSMNRALSSVGCISFRSDGRWLGLARAPSSDIFAGYSASNSIYAAHVTFTES